MPRNVIRITETQSIPVKGQQLLVAACCRVGTKHEEQQQSLKAQIDYYTNYIPGYWSQCITIPHPVLVQINVPATSSSQKTAPAKK